MLTNKEKRELYRSGNYSYQHSPKGDTSKWSIAQWIEWIDKNGEWK